MTQTQLYVPKLYDDKRKKPLLRIKVLRQVGSEGILSVRRTEDILTAHHHREIWESFRALEYKDLISGMGEKTAEMIVENKGRWQKYYQLTERGFLALIKEG